VLASWNDDDCDCDDCDDRGDHRSVNASESDVRGR
jgi:hypothetical protein